jgi:hypothetical protein
MLTDVTIPPPPANRLRPVLTTKIRGPLPFK